MTSLPPPSASQAYCEVSGLDAGMIHMFLGQLVDVAPDDEMTDLPVLAYVLRHSTSGEYMVFDLVIRPDPTHKQLQKRFAGKTGPAAKIGQILASNLLVAPIQVVGAPLRRVMCARGS